jgi:carboxyl-terminal processing protease
MARGLNWEGKRMKAYRVLAAIGVACWLLAAPPSLSAQQANTSETYRQLNLFGEVFERVRADYVEDVSPPSIRTRAS